MILSGFRATPVPGGANGIVLLALATLLAVSLSFACDTAHEDNSTAPVDLEQALADIDISEGSRAFGGIPVKPFPWLINIWAAGPTPFNDFDGRYAGLGMRIKNDAFLAADASCHAAQRYAIEYGMTEILELKVPEKINVSAGPDRPWRRPLGCSHVFALGIRTGFSIYRMKMNPHHRIDDPGNTDDIKEEVPFQKDPKVDKDCYLYAYSANPSAQKSPQDIRTFSRYTVMLLGCEAHDNGYCKFEYHRGANAPVDRNCPLVRDAGAPIICGGKVSFVVDEQKGEHCRPSFSALKLAPHFNDLKLPAIGQDYGGIWY